MSCFYLHLCCWQHLLKLCYDYYKNDDGNGEMKLMMTLQKPNVARGKQEIVQRVYGAYQVKVHKTRRPFSEDGLNVQCPSPTFSKS